MEDRKHHRIHDNLIDHGGTNTTKQERSRHLRRVRGVYLLMDFEGIQRMAEHGRKTTGGDGTGQNTRP